MTDIDTDTDTVSPFIGHHDPIWCCSIRVTRIGRTMWVMSQWIPRVLFKVIFPGPMSGVIANISMPYDQRTSLDLMKYEFQCLWYAAHYQALRRSFGQDRCNKFLHSTALPPRGFCGIFPVDSVTMLPWWSYICPGKIYEKFATFQHTSIIYILAFKMIYFTLFSEPKHPMSTWIHCIHIFS